MSSLASEIKQQGVLEAARDPDTNISAEDAEKAVLKEAQKAGGAAMMFDPNATAEEKAAQARSVSPELRGFISFAETCFAWIMANIEASLGAGLSRLFPKDSITSENQRLQRSCQTRCEL